jgi:hypothetical protein
VAGDIQDLTRGLAPHFSTVDTLLDPTTNAIQTRLREFMTAQWNQPEERLLVYYAGHGFTSYNQNSHDYVGYITGKDTPACHGDDCSNAVGRAVSFNELDAVNRETRSRQVITLFDSCFSGSIFLVRANEGDPKHYDYIRARDAIRTQCAITLRPAQQTRRFQRIALSHSSCYADSKAKRIPIMMDSLLAKS